MTDKEFLLNTYFEDFIKAAKVNLFTGEYIFIKKLQTEQEEESLKEKTIGEYIKKLIDLHVIHPDDAAYYLYHSNLKYIQSRLYQYQKVKTVFSFRRRIENIYRWVTFEILIPKSFSEENPWVVFTWKDSDSDSRALEDTLNILSTVFHKIVKVNLMDDTYEDIKMYDNERTETYGFSLSYSEWIQEFAKKGYVFEGDLDDYYKLTDLDYLKNHFAASADCIRCRYRRKINGKFRWVSMEIMPSIEYTNDNQIVMFYIRDIHDAYVAELNYEKELEYYCNYDTLTGVWNRYYYDKIRSEYDKDQEKNLAVIFADINGLKYVNDTYGHIKGDEYIKSFAKLLVDTFGKKSCFRISGDEFLVIQNKLDRADFMQQFKSFHDTLQHQPKPVASIGWAWSETPGRLEGLVNAAEQEMYLDKQEFYKNYPEYVR